MFTWIITMLFFLAASLLYVPTIIRYTEDIEAKRFYALGAGSLFLMALIFIIIVSTYRVLPVTVAIAVIVSMLLRFLGNGTEPDPEEDSVTEEEPANQEEVEEVENTGDTGNRG